MKLGGHFVPPGDKSVSHRVVLVSLMAKGRCRIEHLSSCADVLSSIKAIRLLGAEAEVKDGDLIIGGSLPSNSQPVHLDCGNSGTTMRLAMGILAGRDGEFILDGDASLRRRPSSSFWSPTAAPWWTSARV